MFHKARGLAATITFGGGDNDDGLLLHVCIPFVFSIYFGIAGMFQCKTCKTGFAIHNQALWLYLLPYEMESNSSDPWYRKNYSFNFPWQYDWYSTEILTQHTPHLAKAVWIEKRKDRKRLGIDSFEMMRRENAAKDTVKETYDYRYVTKRGEVQNRKATIHVNRMTWRMRWWPLLPFKKVSTCIGVDFNEEIGEGCGSWKGGTVGCGYEMYADETPWECLKRMERERKFVR